MSNDPPPRKRRPRYSGTHPVRFDQRYKERTPDAHPGIVEHVRAQGRTPAGSHVPVLVDESIAALRLAEGDVVADCTLGYGGHALAFLGRIGPRGRLVGFDVDAAELERTRVRLAAAGDRATLHRSDFAGIGNALGPLGLSGYDAIFADLGASSMQIDDPTRGFGYKHDGPLDMRMDDRRRITAADVVATIDEDELSTALRELADEPDDARIARRIVAERARQPIARTTDLVRIVLAAKGLTPRDWREQTHARAGDLHPAARTFQALRILVNDELGSLDQLLRIAPYCLVPGGRLAIIAFHGGEERRVERAIREGIRSSVYAEASESAVKPGAEERRANPRSASARLRWAVRSAQG
ncbi:MAG: 16S rRNA (cytosine(1402)-N(4))-methyltransferase RsmH [Planctomycetes bacterium]|nr:16S rRNA (cytosine(1402)-N(4))-methyltransferase RsmH [Planctomycetota bacterium]MBI3847193.1 16S rRNA (cytosine(1402)-N(4))-methyltransferase RsmH [Planctomycetota bacterium]